MNSDKPLQNMDKNDRRLLIVTCFSHFLSHFNMLVFPALALPLTKKFGLDLAQVLGLSFWMYLFFGLTALPWGMAADRWGAKPLLILFHAGAAISSFTAAIYVDSPGKLAVMLAFMGIFSGIYHPVGLGLISKEIKRISMGLAYNGIFGSLGIATAPLITGIVYNLGGAKAVFLTVGFINIIAFAMTFAYTVSDSLKTVEEKPEPTQEQLVITPFIILLFAMMFGGLAYRGSTVIMPAYFELKNQAIFQWLSMNTPWQATENLVATTTTSFILLAGIFGQYTGGRLAEKYDLRLCYLAFHSICVPTAFFMAAVTNLPLIFLAVIYFFFLLGMQPIENTLVAKFIPDKFLHSAYGTKFVLTFGVGALAVQIIEYINTALNIEAVFYALSATSLVLAVIIILLLYKTRGTIRI